MADHMRGTPKYEVLGTEAPLLVGVPAELAAGHALGLRGCTNASHASSAPTQNACSSGSAELAPCRSEHT